MSRVLRLHAFAAVLFIAALWLLGDVNWRTALGVFLFVWANNLIMSHRIKQFLLSERVWR